MPLTFRASETATGRSVIIVGSECTGEEFPSRAHAVVERLRMTVIEKIDGLDERIWIARSNDAEFCISWDVWFPDVSIMAWDGTPDVAVDRLLSEVSS